MIFDPKLINTYPPFVCRIMARRVVVKGGKRKVFPLRTAEIAKTSGLSVERVIWIEGQAKWDDVPVGEAIRFLRGCRMEREKPWRLRWFFMRSVGRTGGFRHLELLPEEERKRLSGKFNEAFPAWMELWGAKARP